MKSSPRPILCAGSAGSVLSVDSLSASSQQDSCLRTTITANNCSLPPPGESKRIKRLLVVCGAIAVVIRVERAGGNDKDREAADLGNGGFSANPNVETMEARSAAGL